MEAYLNKNIATSNLTLAKKVTQSDTVLFHFIL